MVFLRTHLVFHINGDLSVGLPVFITQSHNGPKIKDVVTKSLPDISDTVRDLALRARDGKLQLQEFQVRLSLCRKESKKKKLKKYLRKMFFVGIQYFLGSLPL